MEFSEIYGKWLLMEAQSNKSRGLTLSIICDYSDPNYYKKLRISLTSITNFYLSNKNISKVKTRYSASNSIEDFNTSMPWIKNLNDVRDFNLYYRIQLISKGTKSEDKNLIRFLQSTLTSDINLDIIHLKSESNLTISETRNLALDLCKTTHIQFIELGDLIDIKVLHRLFYGWDYSNLNKESDAIIFTGPICINPDILGYKTEIIGKEIINSTTKLENKGFTPISDIRRYSVNESELLNKITENCIGNGDNSSKWVLANTIPGIQLAKDYNSGEDNLRIFGRIYVPTWANSSVNDRVMSAVEFTLANIISCKYVPVIPAMKYELDTPEYAKCFPDINQTYWNTNLLRLAYGVITENHLHTSAEEGKLVTYIARQILNSSKSGIDCKLYFVPYYYKSFLTVIYNPEETRKVYEYLGDRVSRPDTDSLDKLDLDAI